MEILAAGTSVEPVVVLMGVMLAGAVVVSLVFAKLKQSLILSYFLCGVILGNSGLAGIIGEQESDDLLVVLADIGVILLMFTLGIEFSFGELRKLRRPAFIGGGAQMAMTWAVALLIFALLGGVAWSLAGLLGFFIALSSTALALKLFQERGQGTGPGARLALGVALFQDVAVILMILLLPALYGSGETPVAWALAGAMVRGGLFLGAALLLTKYAIPGLLRLVTATRSRELFTLTVVGLCAGVAAGAWACGLSLPLGAFVAGLVVSGSVYSHRILADVLPFKDLFLAIFFIAVGSLIELDVFLSQWWFYLLVAVLVFCGKTMLAFLAGRTVGYPIRACVAASFALGSIGEFSLVLASKAVGMGLIEAMEQQFLLITTALTMTMAPIAFRFSSPIAQRLENMKVFRRHVRAEVGGVQTGIDRMEGHAIICGYGPVGQRLDEALHQAGVETVVVELNVETVRKLKAEGRPVLFADAAQSETLPLAGISRAALLAVTFPHLEAARAVSAQARVLNPGLPVFARVKFDKEVEVLERLGVDTVVQDELECSVGLVRLALRHLDRDEVEVAEAERRIRYIAGDERGG